MKTLRILLFLLIFITFILLGYLTSTFTGKVTYDRITGNITRIIDGDTLDVFIFSNNLTQRVRLLGINTPEKSQPYYKEAKDNLARYEGKQIQLETKEKDKYDRILGYLLYNGKLINKEQLELGLANLYYYREDEYYREMKQAEENARERGVGIWKKSDKYGCIKLVKLDYLDLGDAKNQEQLILDNKCTSMQVIIKDDANHIYDETIDRGIWTKNFTNIWNDDGDTLTVRDEQGLLLWYRYP